MIEKSKTPAISDSLRELKTEHEQKFVMQNIYADEIAAWLRLHCLPDPSYAEGIISSIYFDTSDWAFMHEKLNSDYLKHKVRLRWYSDFHTSKPEGRAFLEVKKRIGYTRRKLRIKNDLFASYLSEVSLNDELVRFSIDNMLKADGIYFGNIKPVFQVTYSRLRFIEPLNNVRISLDFNIHVPKVNAEVLPYINSSYLPEAVFEVKGPLDKLPSSLFQLTAMGLRKDSFSKYSKCYEKLAGIKL